MAISVEGADPERRKNVVGMSKFIQRIANDTVNNAKIGNEEEALNRIQMAGKQPLASIQTAVASMLNKDAGTSLDDASWETMRLAQSPGTSPEEWKTAYNLVTNEQFAKMTPEQREACKVFTDTGYGSTTTEESFAIQWGKGLPRRDAPAAQAREYQKMISRDQLEASEFGHLIYNPSVPVPQRNQAIIVAAQRILSLEAYAAVQDKFSEQQMSYHLLQMNVPRNSLVAFIDRTNATKDLEGVGSPMQQFEVLLHAGAKFKVIGAEPLYIEAGEAVPKSWRAD